MYNTISPVNFNGSWEVLEKKIVPKYLTSEGGKMVIHPAIYHPSAVESPAQIQAAMNKLKSGWCYSVWKLHPNGGQRNSGSIYEMYAPRLGNTVSEKEAEKFISNDSLLKIANVDTDEATFRTNHNTDSFRVFDVIKLSAQRASELITKYIDKAE